MLALIAGQGRLPVVVAEALNAAGTPARICALHGFPPEADLAVDTTFRIERLGSFLAELVAEGATGAVFAGAIRRPPIDPTAIDAATMPLVPRMMAAIQSGDDAALRTVIAFFEETGLSVRAPQDIAPDLVPEAGVLTSAQPSEQDRQDVARAAEIVTALGSVDVGQGAVVARGLALALEALPGTDAMLRMVATIPPDRRPAGGVLWKAPKPGQDRRIDLPTIGPDTVAAVQEAGLSGIAVPAGGVLFPDRDAAVAAADRAGLFLWVREG